MTKKCNLIIHTDQSRCKRLILQYGLTLLLIGLFAGCGAGQSQQVMDSHALAEQDKSTADMQKEKIFETLTDAVKDGKSNVTVFVDEDPDIIQQGDLVSVNLTAATEDGRLLTTTLVSVADQPGRKWLRGYQKGERLHPVSLIAGEAISVPGLHDIVTGMKKGEKRSVTIPAEKAYGEPDPEKIKQYPSVRRVPRLARLEPLSFVRQYGRFPVKGHTFDFNPYLNAFVMDVFESHVILELSIKPGDDVEDVDYGTTRVTLEDDEFVIRLTPEIGAFFEVGKRKGWITAASEDSFTVDFNHPMAGKAMALEVEVIDFTKASITHAYEISWLEDYDAGTEEAMTENKPMVLLLYADWCQWSQKLMNDVLSDPRVTSFHDDFVWVKINSDVNWEYKERFEQTSYPKLLILSPHEEVIKSLDGFNNVHIVSDTLMEAHLSETTG